jgi:hypothetical protein
MANPITNMVRGLMILYNERPLDLSAVSSLFSEKLPKVMSDDINIERGNAKGIRLAET